ncbi:MAG: tetratricopeptide repeat protein [Syntrophales bacterium]
MEYKAGKESGSGRKGRKPTKVRIVVLVLVIMTVAGLAAGFFYFGNVRAISEGWNRIQNTFSFVVLDRKPHFYSLLLEKNGKDYRLTSNDIFEVSYRDEFVVKEISTDVLFGGGIAVDVAGIGDKNDFGKLLKGIELVDRSVLTGRGGVGENKPGEYSLQISYRGDPIAAIPIRIQITPQDWLRYARSSGNQKVQIEYLKRAIALNREDTNVRRMLASIYLHAGMTGDAISQYKEILALKPDDTAVLSELVKCYLKSGQYEEVIRITAQLVKVNPKDDAALADMALAWGNLGNWKKAIATYEDSLKIQSGNPAVMFRLGEAYEKMNQLGKAAEQYQLVLEKVPKADHVAVALANVTLKLGNYDDAIRWHREVLKRQPKNAAAYANLGLAYGSKGQTQEEIENYRKAIELNPRDPVVHFNLATAYEKAKKEPEAVREYQKALELKPQDSDALEKLADLHFKAKRYSEAVPLYEKAVKMSPRKSVIYTRLGFAYAELKKPAQSRANYEQALRYGGKDPRVRQNLALSYSQTGKTKESIAMYEKLAAGKPTTEVLNTLADAYMREKQYDKAIGTYKKLIELSPKRAAGYASAAYAYGLKGDLDRQIEYYLKSLKWDSEDDEVYLNLGAAYEKKGLFKEALKAYTNAYELNPDSVTAAKKIPQMKVRILQQKQ